MEIPTVRNEFGDVANLSDLVTRVALLALLYFGLALLGLTLLHKTEFIAPLWPASAVAIVFLLRSVPGLWLPLVVACYGAGLLANVLFDAQWTSSLIFGVADMLDALVAAILINWYLSRPMNLKRLGDILAFFLFGALIAPTIGATIAAATVHFLYSASFWQEWYVWWASTAVGVFVVGPLALFWDQAKPRIIFGSPLALETSLIVISGAIACFITFNSADLPLLFLVVPWLLWTGLRIGIAATSWVGLLLSLAAVWATISQAPAMHWFGDDLRTQIQAVQLYLIVLTVPAFVVAITLAERQRAELQSRKLASAVRQTADAIMITDAKGMVDYVNPAFEKMTGFTISDVLGTKPSIMQSDYQDGELYRQIQQDLREGKTWNDVLISRKKDGSLYSEEKTICPIREEDGSISHYIFTGKDITDRINIQERLRFLAYHDVLTELPNRALLMERLERATAGARRSGASIAIMFIDLDGFKLINDALGHTVGDEVLQDVAKRLKKVLREEDTIARLGGDEFTVLIDAVEHIESVSKIAGKLVQIIREPLRLKGEKLSVTCSIGISMFPNDGDNPELLVQRADTAMYRAKDSGRNQVRFYSKEMGEHVVRQLSLVAELQRAMSNEEFVLYYQPQFNLTSHRVEIIEALLRWNHPMRGLEPPAEFLPVLEDSGLIKEVGAWVLSRACKDVAIWNKNRVKKLRVAVNISGVQLEEELLINHVNSALASCDMAPSNLELEITETAMMKNIDLSISILDRLNSVGITIAIDDFGTGYSSLAYLKKFPLKSLKIDRTFIRDLLDDADDSAIVSGILALASSLSLSVVAEGVEKEDQLVALNAKGCHSLQGYLLGRPVPATEIEALIEKIESSEYAMAV